MSQLHNFVISCYGSSLAMNLFSGPGEVVQELIKRPGPEGGIFGNEEL